MVSDDGQIVVPPDAAIDGFYNTCDPADAAAAAGRLRPTAAECLATPSGGRAVAHGAVDLRASASRTAPYRPRCSGGWRSGRARSSSYDTDHSPFLSMRERFVDDLDRLAVSR